ncbi:hypothetical protein [Streptomyces echinatus]|uniref:Uncharacterized protein n=1 Tax=Streptomyces echinatus TaxID=67293 RepID=A0A7W9UU76_9ACTN|nr:hypothetical protein [Streptomyces echinatus]MBB5931410.1 hypothetical protein [Streptomyces echinatus]
MENPHHADGAAAVRRARFSTLPERIRYEDMTEVKTVAPHDPARYAHDPERSWTSFSCLAVDLGL